MLSSSYPRSKKEHLNDNWTLFPPSDSVIIARNSFIMSTSPTISACQHLMCKGLASCLLSQFRDPLYHVDHSNPIICATYWTTPFPFIGEVATFSADLIYKANVVRCTNLYECAINALKCQNQFIKETTPHCTCTSSDDEPNPYCKHCKGPCTCGLEEL